MNKDLTIVTGLWDLGRGNIDGWSKRGFDHYKQKFFELLAVDANMCIFIPKSLEVDVWNIRRPENTKVYIKEVSDFQTWFPFYDNVNKIRVSDKWQQMAGWLPSSPQALLKDYNPMVMSKMFMLHDVSIFNPFNTNYFLWLDGGITNTIHPGYFTHDNILDNITQYMDRFLFVSFPYETSTEIHGFDYQAMKRYSNSDVVNYVCRGGLFGGHKNYISKANNLYYRLLSNTLDDGYMGTEESIFTIMSYLEPKIYYRALIEENGMISKFCEAIKTNNVEMVKQKEISVAVYVISFNSPAQFKALVNSWQNNSSYITNTTNYLLDNSTDISTTDEYKQLCNKYNFTHIKKDNLGICGGRQFVAEHFAETDHDYYIFLEDDMLLNESNTQVCNNGFVKYIDNLYHGLIAIMEKDKYDFIKMSFTEFFGDNKTQWAWYNVPQKIREKVWPNKPKLPVSGLDPDAPLTTFKHIRHLNGITYIDGQIYYCNWPQIVSREGNYKMFIETKWGHPYEQTWMSHMFQLALEDKLNGAVLLASPINHNRFDHYGAGLRKES